MAQWSPWLLEQYSSLTLAALITLCGPMLNAEHLPSPSPAWGHLPAAPFRCTDLSLFPSDPRRELLAFSHFCFLLLFHDQTRGERSSRRWASQSQYHLQVHHGKDPAESQSEIHTASNSKLTQKVCERQAYLSPPLPLTPLS